jgi:hypothetical protein
VNGGSFEGAETRGEFVDVSSSMNPSRLMTYFIILAPPLAGGIVRTICAMCRASRCLPAQTASERLMAVVSDTMERLMHDAGSEATAKRTSASRRWENKRRDSSERSSAPEENNESREPLVRRVDAAADGEECNDASRARKVDLIVSVAINSTTVLPPDGRLLFGVCGEAPFASSSSAMVAANCRRFLDT